MGVYKISWINQQLEHIMKGVYVVVQIVAAHDFELPPAVPC